VWTCARVPSDWWAPSSIRWFGKHHGVMRILKRGSSRFELTSIAQATERVFLRWDEPIWGKLEIREPWRTIEGGSGCYGFVMT
jgi:hypothetical protein